MENKDGTRLKTMRDQHSSDMVKGTKEMLRYWLQRQPCASWNQLIEVLRMDHIGLDTLASDIEEMLEPQGKRLIIISIMHFF